MSVALCVEQSVLTNHPRLRIAEDDELVVGLLVPNQMRVLLVIHADRYEACLGLLELTSMLRELAQLAHADRSPVAAIEQQHDPRSAQTRKGQRLAILIVQGEVRRGLQAGE